MSLRFTLRPLGTTTRSPTTIGASREPRKVWPVLLTLESMGSMVRMVTIVPSGMVTVMGCGGGGGGGGAGAEGFSGAGSCRGPGLEFVVGAGAGVGAGAATGAAGEGLRGVRAGLAGRARGGGGGARFSAVTAAGGGGAMVV